MRLWAIMGLLLLSACTTRTVQENGTKAEGASPVIECERMAVHAVLHERQATLYLPGLALSLPRMRSDSGARYAANGYLFWRRDNGVLLRTPERSYSDCRLRRQPNPWARAWLRGVDFRAVGQEPGWLLEISKDQRIDLRWQYDKHRLTTPVPKAKRHGELVVYHTEHQGSSLTVSIMDRPCRDSMKGDSHDYAVRVEVGDQTLLGCGRGRVPVESAP